MTCTPLSAGLSGEFGNSPLQRKGASLSGSAEITLSVWTSEGWPKARTLTELAIENSRGRSGGNTSKM